MGFIPFPNDICPKVNEIARLEVELTYYDVAVQLVNHNVSETRTYATRMNSR